MVYETHNQHKSRDMGVDPCGRVFRSVQSRLQIAVFPGRSRTEHVVIIIGCVVWVCVGGSTYNDLTTSMI